MGRSLYMQDRRLIPVGEELSGEMREYCKKNELLLELAAQAQASLIEWQGEVEQRVAVDLFPKQSSTPCSELLKVLFYSKYAQEHPKMHFTLAGTQLTVWNFMATADDTMDEDLRRALCAVGAPVVRLTPEIIENYQRYCQDGETWSCLTPARLREWLKTADVKAVGQASVAPLLKYCMSDGQLGDLMGCPLCPTLQMGADALPRVVCFSTTNPLVGWRTISEEKLLRHFATDRVADLPKEVAARLVEAKVLCTLDTAFLRMVFEGDEHAKRASLEDFYCWFKLERPPDISELEDVELICIYHRMAVMARLL